MKIAVTYDNGEVFQHFGHTENFKVYEVEDGKVVRQTALVMMHLQGLLQGKELQLFFAAELEKAHRTHFPKLELK